MNKEDIKNIIREMFISNEIQIGVGEFNWVYQDSEGNLILMISDLEEEKKPV